MKFFCVVGLIALSGVWAYADEPIDFAREVLPILSDKCFLCHGPDTKKKGDLRLDSRAAAISDRGGYRAINPSDLANSEIIHRIHDREDPMPPKDAEKQLSAEERTLITAWIKQGGEYAQHWAFIPPTKKSAEKTIDHYISATHADNNVEFAPEADRSTLARRAALVLTGLPPDPEQLKVYLEDTTPNAYSRLVDQLLASPHYGEHQARYWLDAVRYGDTHGLHLDNRRAIFPYRDWVVRALNNNMPFDQFITEQLAGDLLPNPTLDQHIATGFVRMNPSTAEGGAIKEEFQAKNNFDRTENLGTVLLGMTLNCARCHTHKYDPILQEEYYRLFAFFNSTAEEPLDGNAYVYEPILKVPADQAAWQLWSVIAGKRDDLLARAQLADWPDLNKAITYARSLEKWMTHDWKATGNRKSDEPLPVDQRAWKKIGGFPGLSRRERISKKDSVRWMSFDLETPMDQLFWLHFTGSPASEVYLGDAKIEYRPNEGDAQTALLHVPQGRHSIKLKLPGMTHQPKISITLTNPWHELVSQGHWQKLDTDHQLLALADPNGPFQQHPLHTEAKALGEQLANAKSRFATTLVAKELPTPRPTHVLMRGEYQRPVGEELEPGVFKVMNPFPHDAPRNRLGLAQWLTAREHPLVSRVLINRVWQRTFGYGLVRTPEDFGLQGAHPTHPELLDWLAVEFQESGWDLKHMLRLMVTSRTFKQDSRYRNDVADPENKLYARGPSFRLDAEVIRDLGLWSSGLLDPHMGGEGVKPYQPAGLWKALMHPGSNTKEYEADAGNRLYRRSLYVYWKRTSPHPMMTLFNAPDRESSCVKRDRASTPLQSLGLLNETQRVEMARMLAQRLLQQEKNDADRLNKLFYSVTCRPANAVERKACNNLLATLKHRYTTSPADAEHLLSIGDAGRDTKIDAAEHAAWTQVAVTVLASDVSILLY